VARPRVGLYGVLETSEEGWQKAGAVLATVAARLAEAGAEVRQASELVCDDAKARAAAEELAAHDPDVLLAVIICWSFDHHTLTILRRLPRPLVVLSIPGIRAGSIVGAHQLGSLLTDLGLQHAVCYGDPAAPETYRPVLAYSRAASAMRRLGLGKIGYVGHRTPGMTPIAFDEVEVTRLFGAQVVSYGWGEIESLAASLPAAEVEQQTARLTALGSRVTSSSEALAASARLFLALRDQARREELLAMAIGCYPQYAGLVCVACGLLGEEGVAAGCEADMNSTLAMFLLQAFTGQPAHFGEILEVDEAENAIITSHCGCAPPSLAADRSEIAIMPVRLWERGACLRFPAKAGPATFVNLVGRRGTYRLCAVEGEATTSGMVFEGNPVRLVLRFPVRELLETIGEHGFGHHWMLGYGHVIPELKALCRLSGVRGVFP
jgi:L-fucose isomerase-like protein